MGYLFSASHIYNQGIRMQDIVMKNMNLRVSVLRFWSSPILVIDNLKIDNVTATFCCTGESFIYVKEITQTLSMTNLVVTNSKINGIFLCFDGKYHDKV